MGNVRGYVSAANLIAQERVAGEMMRAQIEEFEAYAKSKGWELYYVGDEILVDTKGQKDER